MQSHKTRIILCELINSSILYLLYQTENYFYLYHLITNLYLLLKKLWILFELPRIETI